MKRTLFSTAIAVSLTASVALADFQYQQTTKVTGGALVGAMKFAGVFSKKARDPLQPMTSTVMIQGNRMVSLRADSAEVIDLDKETMTHIDFTKRTYTVVTFAQFKQRMEEMSQRMHEKQPDQPDMSFKVSVKETGQKKQVSGFDTKEAILTLEMDSTDQKSGQKGALTITNDMWLAPDAPGYDEVRKFHRRMAEKLSFDPGAGLGMMARPDMLKGMAEVAKEASKLDGIPVLSLTAIGGNSEGQPGAASQPPQQQSSGGLGRLGGLGGLGGFHRKKQQDDNQQSAAEQNSTASGSLIEMTTELTGFSSAAVDPSKFDVPAGFQQVEPPEMGRRKP